MDELKIYGKALSAVEISDAFAAEMMKILCGGNKPATRGQTLPDSFPGGAWSGQVHRESRRVGARAWGGAAS